MSGIKGMKMKKKRVLSQEEKDKISKSIKKKWEDKNYREMMGNAHKHKLPKEWKENIAWGMIGKNKSEETKSKMSNYQSNRTKEHEVNMREAWKKQWNSLTKEEQIKRLSKWIEAGHDSFVFLEPSSLEKKVAKQLDDIGIRYIQQKKIFDGNRSYYLDFYIPQYKLVIECNGNYWHNKDDRIIRDKKLKEYVESTGRKIIFIWEDEIKDEWFWIGDFLEKGR